MALDELHETTSLSRGDLDVGDLAEALEERSQLILGNVARQASDEDGGVVGVRELVHGLRSAVVAKRRGSTHGVHAGGHATGSHGAGLGHPSWAATRLVLGGGGGDPHGAVAAVDALHLGESALLVALVGEADEAVATGHARDGVGHDLGGLARWESSLEERDEDVLIDLRAEIANEDGELGASLVTGEQLVHALVLGWGVKDYEPGF